MTKVTITIKKEDFDRLLPVGVDGVLKRLAEEHLVEMKEDYRRTINEWPSLIPKDFRQWTDEEVEAAYESLRMGRMTRFTMAYDLDVDFDGLFDDESLSSP